MQTLLTKQGYNAADPAGIPGIFAHAAPVLNYVPSAPRRAPQSLAATHPLPARAAAHAPPAHREFIDELNDDFVTISGGSVTFVRAAILDDSSLSSIAVAASRAKSQPTASAFSSPRRNEGSFRGPQSLQAAASLTAADLAPNSSSFVEPVAFAMSDTDAQSPNVPDRVNSPDPDLASDPNAFTQASMAFSPAGSPAAASFTDALHLQTTGKAILAAKRCATRTSPQHHGGIVAVLHDEFTLAIYNMHHVPVANASATVSPAAGPHQPGGTISPARTAPVPRPNNRPANTSPARGHEQRPAVAHRGRHVDTMDSNAGVPDTARVGPIDPLVTYQCRPKTLRFGNGAYPIRDFFWLPAPVAWASGGKKLRAPSTTQTLLIVTSITIEVLQVFPFANRPEHAVVVLHRLTTRTDYCAYDRFSRVLVSVNKEKPTIIKPFVVISRIAPPSASRSAAAAANAQATASAGQGPDGTVASSTGDEVPACGEAPNAVIAASPHAADNATVSLLTLPQIKLTDSDTHVVPDASLPDRLMHPPPLQLSIRPLTLYDRLFIAVHTARQEIALFELQGGKSTDLSNARFTKVAALCLQESQGRYALQVIDNLLVAHCLTTGLSFAFDIHVDETIDPQHATASSAMLARGQRAMNVGAYVSSGASPTNGAGDLEQSMSSSMFLNSTTSAQDFLARLSAPATKGEPAKIALRTPVAVCQLRCFASPLGARLMANDMQTRQGLADDFGPPPASGRESPSTVLPPANPLALAMDAGDEMFTRGAYYSGSAPLLLDRATGRVVLLGINACGLASTMQPMATRTLRFLANRSGAGAALAAALVIKQAVHEQEPLAFVGRMFDIVAERDFTMTSVAWHASNVSRATIGASANAPLAQAMLSTSQSSASPNSNSGTAPGHPSVSAALLSPKALRSNPVASDGQFHVRRAMPPGFRSVVGNADAVAALIPTSRTAMTAAGDAPAPSLPAARQVSLTFLEAIDAEHGISVIDEYVRASRERSSGGADSAASPSASPGNSAAASPHAAAAAAASTLATLQGANSKYRIPQVAMLRLVFDPLLEVLRSKRDQEAEHDEDMPQTRFYLRYLRAVVLEYSRALTMHRVGNPAGAIHPEVQGLIIDLCTMPPSADYYSLHQMLMYRIVHDSTPVALRLLQIAAGYPPAFQAALDMLGRLKNWDLVVEIYAKHGMPERAAKLAIMYGVTSVPAATLLDLAASADDEAQRRTDMRKQRTFFDDEEAELEIRPVDQHRLRPESLRSVFAQVYTILQPYLRVIQDNEAEHSSTSDAANSPLIEGNMKRHPSSALVSNASSPRRATMGPRGASPSLAQVSFIIQSYQLQGFAERFATLQDNAARLSR
jgi:hypothetical protein